MTTDNLSSPCGTCPWRRENQTRAAVRASPRSPVPGSLRWFDQRNLKKHWRRVASGGMMPCHTTDPRAHMYGGKRAQKVEPHLCVGLCILARREVTAYLHAGGNYQSYKQTRGRRRFTLAGLAQWAARLVYPGAKFEVFSMHDGMRSFAMPSVRDDANVELPWESPS